MSKENHIYVGNNKVTVSKEVYKTYWQSKERERYLLKKAIKYNIYIDSLFDDYERNSVEYYAIEMINKEAEENAQLEKLFAKLHLTLQKLTDEEFKLINAIYFQGITQRQYAKKTNQKQTTISWKHRKILAKIKKMFE